MRDAAARVGEDRVVAQVNNALTAAGLQTIAGVDLDADRDQPVFRRALGTAAKTKPRPWFKNIDAGEHVATVIGPLLASVSATPLAKGIASLRTWADA